MTNSNKYINNIKIIMELINNINLESVIGNTPLIEISYKFKGKKNKIYAKCESYNMTGSIKDRIAYYIIAKSYKTGVLKLGYLIAEATSGNTGIFFSAIGAALGHKVKIFMPDWMSNERIKIIKTFGADVRLVSNKENGFLESIEITKDLGRNKKNVFLPNQFENILNSEAHYNTTGPEIYNKMKDIGLTIDGFVAGVGTGGTVMGISAYLKEHNKNAKIFPLEP